MPVTAFDTLKYAKQLKLSGIPSEQAEAQATALAEALQSGFQELATKSDVKNDMEQLRQELKNEAALIRQEMKGMEARLDGQITLVKWMLGATFAGVIGIMVRLFFFRIA